MINSIKRIVLSGAVVMVMMSFAAPAMAAPLSDYSKAANPYSSYTELLYTDVYKQPVEAGGPGAPQPVVVGPAPTPYSYTGCWSSDANGNLVPAGGPC